MSNLSPLPILSVLSQPNTQTLWQLRSSLLAAGIDRDAAIMRVATAFAEFLNSIQASSSSRAYSHLASMMDMGAVGGVALQNLLNEGGDKDAFWQRLLTGGLSEGLMVLAARQYVKAFDTEVQADLFRAAWVLYDELWYLSQQRQPGILAEERKQQIEALLAPLHQQSVPSLNKAALVARLFQVLLIAHMPSI